MSAKWTEGPWEVVGTEVQAPSVRCEDTDYPRVVVDVRGAMSINAAADLKLIVAAPDLAEALTDILERITEAFPALENTEAVTKARAALAKAGAT